VSRIILASASTGKGHISAAKALEVELDARAHEAEYLDVLDLTPRAFQAWYRGGYELLVRRRPEPSGSLYKDSDSPGWKYSFQCWLDMVFCRGLDQYLDDRQADWIVCTHSLPQPRIDAWRQKSSGLRMAAVVTDLYPHSMWLRGEPDHWFVPSEWSKTVLEERVPGSGERTTVTGIPIHPAFRTEETKAEARAKLGLDPEMPTILVTIGGIGGGPLEQLLTRIAEQSPGIQAAVACGWNASAEAAAGRAAEKLDMKMKIWGHAEIEEMASLMRACDLLVGKPGGLTTSEALAAGCPFLVAEPFLIPGQEEGNADFLVEEGIGVRASTLDQAGELTAELIQDPDRLASMSKRALAAAKPEAAGLIAEKLAQL
jgi:processive 1,2-diacylglycerol beta-glucosyltransferase